MLDDVEVDGEEKALVTAAGYDERVRSRTAESAARASVPITCAKPGNQSDPRQVCVSFSAASCNVVFDGKR